MPGPESCRMFRCLHCRNLRLTTGLSTSTSFTIIKKAIIAQSRGSQLPPPLITQVFRVLQRDYCIRKLLILQIFPSLLPNAPGLPGRHGLDTLRMSLSAKPISPYFCTVITTMKQNKILIVFALLILTGALYRIIPGRPMGFAPQLAMALFGGAILRDKKWAFALPLFSMFLSDALYEGLYRAGISTMAGFYEGQGINYLLLAGITFIGIGMRHINAVNVTVGSIAAPVLFFLTSNLATWLGHGGYNLPMTGEGLFQTYVLGLPFLYMSLASTMVFGGMLFGSWYALKGKQESAPQRAAA